MQHGRSASTTSRVRAGAQAAAQRVRPQGSSGTGASPSARPATGRASTPARPSGAVTATLALVSGILSLLAALGGLLGLVLVAITIVLVVRSARVDDGGRKRRIVAVVLAIVGALAALASAVVGWYLVGQVAQDAG